MHHTFAASKKGRGNSKEIHEQEYLGILKVYIQLHSLGAALERVPLVPVNPWIFRTFASEPMDF